MLCTWHFSLAVLLLRVAVAAPGMKGLRAMSEVSSKYNALISIRTSGILIVVVSAADVSILYTTVIMCRRQIRVTGIMI